MKRKVRQPVFRNKDGNSAPVPSGFSAGKGDGARPKDGKKYRNNYNDIDWSNSKKEKK
jgi:hypothetical protein